MLNKKKIGIMVAILIFIIVVIIISLEHNNNNNNNKNTNLLEEDDNYQDLVGEKVTATFMSTGLDYIENDSISCYIKEKEESCKITLPIYNIKGGYNFFWSIKELPNMDLTNYEWDGNYFYGVGTTYELTRDTTFYPNTNTYHFDWANEESQNYRPYYKYRKIDIIKSEKIGHTFFEFERGIPESYINQYINEIKQVYEDMPWIFVPCKVFAMTETTYDLYSIAYGLTQHFYNENYEAWSSLVSVIDVQYDTVGIKSEEIAPNSIALNATIHELAHAWDFYYKFSNREETYPQLISETSNVEELYNSVKNSEGLYKDGDSYISKVEFFAGMVTNYYWHILDKGPNKPYYAMQNGKELTNLQKNDLKKIIDTYASKTKSYNK